jgi:FkbM family methyltransferase
MRPTELIRLILILFVSICKVYSEEAVPRFNGILGTVTDKISNLTINAAFFMPYNPTIIEIGGYRGQNTAALSNTYPKGRIISFEPNPKAFNQLLATVQNCKNVSAYNLALNTYNGYAKLNINHGIYCNDENLEGLSSLLNEDPEYPYFRGPQIDVPCVVLDDWCQQNGIDRVHFIQLDCEGYELQILKSSPNILQNVLVICTKTNFFPFRNGTSQYAELEAYLDSCGFTMLSHWYREGLQGEATFIRKYIYNALFD